MRLIDADKARENSTIDLITHFLDRQPSIEAEPVKHGRWEKQSGLYSCSVCGSTCPYDVQADVIEYWTCNYCPICGAKMDLEDGKTTKLPREEGESNG